MTQRPLPLAGVIAIAAALLVLRVETLPLMPIDETRYLSVAWEMWQHQQFLVPMLNGEAYAHKPPLLFWLINTAWSLFGPSDGVSRLTIPLLGLASFALLDAIVRVGFPAQRREGRWAPAVLLSLSLWTLFLALSMFDILLTTCLLVGVLGLVGYVRRARLTMVALAGLGLGLGLLAKGPVVLLYWLPLALGVRWWKPSETPALVRYPLAILAMLTLGGMIGLAWALPAALAGGEEYANAILWHQVAGRVSNAFDHARPWYWYLPLLPLVVFPWPLLRIWRGPIQASPLERFALVGSLPAIVLLSLVSGKQVHYLMPILPFVALWLAARLSRLEPRRSTAQSLFLAACALLMLMLPDLVFRFADGLDIAPGYRLLAVIPLALAVASWRQPDKCLQTLAWPLALTTLLVAAGPMLNANYNLTPMAQRIGAYQSQGVPVAYIGEYADQFHFLGRLTENIASLDHDAEVGPWLRAHPLGVVVEKPKDQSLTPYARLLYRQAYRGDEYLLVSVAPPRLAAPMAPASSPLPLATQAVAVR